MYNRNLYNDVNINNLYNTRTKLPESGVLYDNIIEFKVVDCPMNPQGECDPLPPKVKVVLLLYPTL